MIPSSRTQVKTSQEEWASVPLSNRRPSPCPTGLCCRHEAVAGLFSSVTDSGPGAG